MSTKTSRLVLIFASLNFILVPFQNCSAPINSEMLSEAASTVGSVSVPVEISFKDSTSLYNSKNMTQSFALNAEAESSIESIQCQLNSSASVDCSSKEISLNQLADGDHTLKVTILQKNNLKTEAIKTFRVDSTPPLINVSQKPASTTNLNSASFAFNAADILSGVLSTECSLNNASYSICTSPYNLSALAQGAQSVKIKATDRAGNVSLIFSHSWSIDSAAPAVQLTSMPAAVTQSASAAFQFSGSLVASYECSIDNGAFAACTSPKNYSGLVAGARSFKVRGVSSQGVKSAEVIFNWVIDNAAPSVAQITSGFSAIGSNKSGQISFSSADILSGIKEYQCSLNNAAFVACTSPRVITAIEGLNIFKVKAYDFAGNVSGEASTSFTIDSLKPTLSFTQAPGASTTAMTAQFVFVSADANGSGVVSVQCSLDNAAFANCTSPRALSNLSISAHKFSVQVRDLAGNTTTVEHNWVVNAVVAPPPAEPPPASGNLIKVLFAAGHMNRTLLSCDGGQTWIKDRSVDTTKYCETNDCDHTPYASRGLDASGGYMYTNTGWGYNGFVKRTRDGVNWTTIDSGSWGGGIAATSSQVIHLKEGGEMTKSAIDPIAWTKINFINDTNKFSYAGLSRLGNKLFITGRGAPMGVSYDQGNTWTYLPNALISSNPAKFAEGNGVIVAVSYTHRQNQSTLGYVARSTDQGKTWSSVQVGEEIMNVTFNGSQFIFVSAGKVFRSVDGANWTTTNMVINGSQAPPWILGPIAYHPEFKTYGLIKGGWGSGYANQVAYKSTDGVNWTTLSGSAFMTSHPIMEMMTADVDPAVCQ